MRAILVALVLTGALSTACSERADPVAGDVEVQVGIVGLDPRTDSPVVVLRERDGGRSLPIWIGTSEARSIAIELEELEPPRPNTHDLAKRLLASLDARLDRTIVTDLDGGTYYAVMVLRSGDRRFEVDARPSDAIAIALRMGAPLFVREALLKPRSEASDGERSVDEFAL